MKKRIQRIDFDEGPISFMEIQEIVPPLKERMKLFLEDHWIELLFVFFLLLSVFAGLCGAILTLIS